MTKWLTSIYNSLWNPFKTILTGETLSYLAYRCGCRESARWLADFSLAEKFLSQFSSQTLFWPNVFLSKAPRLYRTTDSGSEVRRTPSISIARWLHTLFTHNSNCWNSPITSSVPDKHRLKFYVLPTNTAGSMPEPSGLEKLWLSHFNIVRY